MSATLEAKINYEADQQRREHEAAWKQYLDDLEAAANKMTSVYWYDWQIKNMLLKTQDRESARHALYIDAMIEKTHPDRRPGGMAIAFDYHIYFEFKR